MLVIYGMVHSMVHYGSLRYPGTMVMLFRAIKHIEAEASSSHRILLYTRFTGPPAHFQGSFRFPVLDSQLLSMNVGDT